MNLMEAKQILKANGCRLLKESDGGRLINEGPEDSFDQFELAVEIAMDDDRALTEYSDFYGDTILNAKKAEISKYIQEYWDNEFWPHKTVADNIDDCVEYVKRKVLD